MQATVLAAIDMSWVFFISEEVRQQAMQTAAASRAASEYAIRLRHKTQLVFRMYALSSAHHNLG